MSRSTHLTETRDVGPGPQSPPRPRGTFRGALDRLPAVQKTAKGAPAYSRFVNRRLGRLLAAAAYTVGATPNQVSAVSGLFTFGGIAVIALVAPSGVVAVVVTLALVIGYALDSADGQLARLRGGGSPAGEWLDHVLDSVKVATIHLAVLISFYRFADLPGRGFLLVPIGFAAVANVWYFSVFLTDQLRRHQAARGGPAMPTAQATAPLWRSLLALPADYGVLCLVFLTFGADRLFLVLYCLLLAGCTGILTLSLPAWFAQMRSYGRPA